MPRPRARRMTKFKPQVTYFKPRAVPLRQIEEVDLWIEELEALRLCDLLGLGQAKAAEKMETSQSTLQRILESARKKVAEALIQGKAIRVNNPST